MATVDGQDEKGNKRQAQLQGDRLKVRSVSTDEVLFAVQEGRAFQAYTEEMVLTGTDKLIVFFIENNDVAPILVTSATIGSGISLGGSDNSLLVEQVGNISDTDPIVASGDDIISTNRKSGDPRPFIGVIKKGPQAVSGDEFAANGVLADFTLRETFDLSAEIPKGGRTAISIRPPVGNTSITVTLSVSFHVIDKVV